MYTTNKITEFFSRVIYFETDLNNPLNPRCSFSTILVGERFVIPVLNVTGG
jgi:hypothetical protein